MVRRLLYAAMLCWCAAQGLAQTEAQPLGILQISALSESNPKAAIATIDELIAAQMITDKRTLFDLLRRKATLLVALDRPQEAGRLYLELGQVAARERDVLNWDPVALYDRAIDAFLTSSELEAAQIALSLIVDEQRDGGASGEAIAATLDRVARLWDTAGDTARAAQARNSAKAARMAKAPERSAGEAGGFRQVKVFYATDRARSGAQAPSEFYGGARGTLDLGVAMVTIPDSHKAGVLEAPSIWRLEFGPNPAKHVVLQSVTPVPQDAFYADMNRTLQDLGASDAFVFVHGFNVRFDAAAKRTAQMAYDMNFPGVPILYSWPSRGSTLGYIADTAVVRLSGRRLSRFLDSVIERSGATTIHIVAHSMGNRALTDALELLALRHDLGPTSAPVFDQVLFAAPDLDADLFSEMMPVIRPVAKRLTLYASNQDWALATSRQLHGDAPRAGQGGDTMLARREFDSIDMSELGEDMMAHSYFADDSSAIADMVALFWRNAAPNLRCGLQPVERAEGTVQKWLYRTDICEDRTLVQVLAHLRKAEVSDAKTAERVLFEMVPNPQAARKLAPIVKKLFEGG